MADITVKCPHCDTQLKIDEVYFRPPFNDPKNAGRIIIDFEHPVHGVKIPESGEKNALPKANEG